MWYYESAVRTALFLFYTCNCEIMDIMNRTKIVFETYSTEETAKIAFQMAADAAAGQVFALIGDLGVGEEVGFDEYVYGDGVCLIEWANRIEEILPDDTIYVVIEKDLGKGLDYRKITVVRPGEGS